MSVATIAQPLTDDSDEQASLAILNYPSVDKEIPNTRHGKELTAASTLPLVNTLHKFPKSENDMPTAHQDLDWSYTLRCVRQWSPNALLTYLHSHAFSIPPKNPSPFLNINIVSQDGEHPEPISLPMLYRVPLLMVAKYMWETVLLALSTGRDEWIAWRTNIFHISRLFKHLFDSARALGSSIEKGWRCVAFDQFLARFYKHCINNTPAVIRDFREEHGPRVYDRDALKLDWKRWSFRGQNGIKLTEQEIITGISADQLRKTLAFSRDADAWTLDGKTLTFITSEVDEGMDWSSASELTDVDLEEEVEEVKPSLGATSNSRSKILGRDPGSSSKRPNARRPYNNNKTPESGPRRIPDPARLSTLRNFATSVSDRVSSPPISNLLTAPVSKPPAQTGSSTNPTQTSITSSPSSRSLVVLIKRRPPVVQAESSAVGPSQVRNADMPSTPAGGRDSIKRPIISVLGPRQTGLENDTARSPKRRRIDGSDDRGEGSSQALGYRPISSSTNGVVVPSLSTTKRSVGVQLTNCARAEASVQATPVTVRIEQGSQTDTVNSGSQPTYDRRVSTSDSSRLPTTTVAAYDIAVQAEASPSKNVSPAKTRLTEMDVSMGEVRDNLSFVVDKLVSSRLLSLTRALKSSSEPSSENGNGTNGTSLPLFGGSGTSSATRTSNSGADGHSLNALFDELRLLREEAHAREQRAMEEMRALRHLHNVEVDSLRSRLAYLESQVAREYETTRRTVVGEHSARSGADNRTYMPPEPRLGDKHNHFRGDDKLVPARSSSSFGTRPFVSPMDGPIAGSSQSNGFGGRYPSMTRSGNDGEFEECPLPSKAQRKSHIIAFPRPSVAG